MDAAFNYKRTFNREDQELEFSVNTSIGRSTFQSNNEQWKKPVDSLFYGVQNRNPGKENETQIVLDYTQPLAETIILGTGFKTTFIDINSHSTVLSYQPGDKRYQYDGSLSNSLTYHQQVYAAYAELTFPVAKLFDIKMGSRYERTEINADYSDAQQAIKTPGYNTLVPSIFLSKN